MRFKIDWASLIVGSKLLFLFCFTLYLRAIFQRQALGWKGGGGGGGGRIFGRAIQRRFFCVTGLGGLFLEGRIH